MVRATRIWNVTAKRGWVDRRTLVILGGEKIESALPKARKILADLDREEKEVRQESRYEIVEVERAGTVDAF